jgi:hypothetical protein
MTAMAGGLRIISIIACAAFALTGCGSTGGTRAPAVDAGAPVGTPVSQGPTTIVKGQTPAQLYSHLARQVRGCWLNPRSPVLKNHIFRAEAGAGGPSGSETNIEIHERARDGKRGLKAFSIDFIPQRDGTRIVAQNYKLPYDLGQKLVSDVGYWAQGGPNCDGPSQPSGATPRGSISGTRVNR